MLEDIHQYVAPVGLFAQLRKENINFVTPLYLSIRPAFCLSVCLSARNNSAGTGRNFIKFYSVLKKIIKI